jgi:RimJ/RimL family protein N-acetyltransferase
MHLQTDRLKLVLKTPEEVRVFLKGMQPHEKAAVSQAWLALLAASTLPDPWVHGFAMVDRNTGNAIGTCGFTGPPGADGSVEIAYGVNSEHTGKGYATEAAQALVTYAFAQSQVRLVCAHTSPEVNASGRILTKCGFERIGEVIHPEDGLIWRWEKRHA